MKQHHFTYIMTNKPDGTLYVGMTDDLIRRMSEHRLHLIPDSFTDQYNLETLVYYESHPNAEAAMKREQQLKRWRRQWKVRLIESINPEWRDLWVVAQGEFSQMS